MLCLTRDLDLTYNIQIYTPNKANHFSLQIISQQAKKITLSGAVVASPNICLYYSSYGGYRVIYRSFEIRIFIFERRWANLSLRAPPCNSFHCFVDKESIRWRITYLLFSFAVGAYSYTKYYISRCPPPPSGQQFRSVQFQVGFVFQVSFHVFSGFWMISTSF